MAHESGSPDLDRRKLLKYIGAGSAAGIAGCSGGGGGGTSSPTDTGTTTSGTETTPEKVGRTDVPERAVSDKTFVDASTSTAQSMVPINVTDTTTDARLARMYDLGGTLVGPDTFGPRWFKSWELSDDLKTVTYTLQENLEWGAGYGQLTAEDYMYFLNELALLEGKEDWYGYTRTGSFKYGVDQELMTFEKVGKYKFRGELPMSRPQFLHEDLLPFLYIVPKGLLKKYRPQEDAEGLKKDPHITDPEGEHLSKGNLGPYQIKQANFGKKWVYERNDDYYLREHADADAYTKDKYNKYYDYDKSPYFGGYTVQQFDEQSTALSALKTGSVDTAGIGGRKVNNYRGNEGLNIWEDKFGNGTFFLNLNHRINGWKPIRNSKKVRRAMGELYDKEIIIKRINKGNALPTSTFHPRWGPFYPPSDKLYEPKGSVKKAKQLLKEGTGSGYGYDSKGRFTNPEGEQVKLKAVRTTGNPATKLGAKFMKDRLKKAGIKYTIEPKQWSALLRQYAMNSASNVDGVKEPDWSKGPFNGGPWNQAASAKDWDVMHGLGFTQSPWAPWSAIKATMWEKGAFNLWGIHQDTFNIKKVVQEASTASDPETTQQKMTELFGFLSRFMPIVWTQTGMAFVGFRDDVVGFPGKPTDWGYKATSYFASPDSDRLLAFKKK